MITRTTLPVLTTPDSERAVGGTTGLGDMTILALPIHEQKIGAWGPCAYIKDNKFTYYYDFFRYDDYKIESTALPAGEGRVEKIIFGRYGMDTFDIGMDFNAPVVRGKIYKTPYEFTGTIDKVTIELQQPKKAG